MSYSEGYRIRDPSKPHFLTLTVVGWLDVFTRYCYRDLLLDNLGYCILNKGMILYGYVIMSNHVHLIVQAENGLLSELLRDFKKHTSKIILRAIKDEPESRRDWMISYFSEACKTHSRNEHYQFWKYGNHPEEIYSTKFLWSKLDYIHLNPVRARIVKRASEYIYSSASNYVNGEGIISVSLAANPVIDVHKKDAFWKSISW